MPCHMDLSFINSCRKMGNAIHDSYHNLQPFTEHLGKMFWQHRTLIVARYLHTNLPLLIPLPKAIIPIIPCSSMLVFLRLGLMSW